MRDEGNAGTEADQVDQLLTALSAILIPILVAAFVLLYIYPETAGADLFAWPVRPKITAMILGATYMSGAYFFLVVLLFRRWSEVRLGFWPITAFAATLGLVTILHWDRFAHDRIGFQLWAFLYFAVPLILPILWYRNWRRVAGGSADRRASLGIYTRGVFALLGAVLVVAGFLLLVVPDFMIGLWPWTLTPLTARLMSAIYVLPGLVSLAIAYDGRWEGARYLLQALAFAAVLMLLAIFVARDDLDWGHPGSWTFTASLIAILVLVASTYKNRAAAYGESGASR
ncbi:MAG: hypothetical protein JJT95_00425 [Pararhodobacter sp.]|nr:hypothetical protein [Pararhodobacter sp.]